MAEDNKRYIRTLEYHEADAMALAHALMIHATSAWMGNNSRAMERMHIYQQQFEAIIPEAIRVFDDNVWSEIAFALQHASSFTVDLVPPHGSDYIGSRGGRIAVNLVPVPDAVLAPPQVGGLPPKRAYKWNFHSAKYDIRYGDDRIRQVFDLVTEFAPMGCTGTYDDKAEEANRYRW